jgi:hypothetical protein
MLRRLAALCLAAVTLIGVAAPARAGLLELGVDLLIGPGAVPECQDGSVISTIRDKFGYAAVNVMKAPLVLESIDQIRQTYLYVDNPSPVVRRYCQAIVGINNGRHSTLYYLIEQRQGFVGLSWNVEFCVLGYEPWHVHDGSCRTVRKWW